MTGFQMRSRNNIIGVAQTRACPGGPFINPVGVHLDRRTGATAPPQPGLPLAITRVALVGVLAEEFCPSQRCKILTGPGRCADAHLAVVPDLSMLHDLDVLASDEDLAVSFLYIVSLGVEITTKTQLAAVQGNPARLSRLQCVRHIPALKQETTFCVGERISIEQEGVLTALKRIARAPGSKFVVSDAFTPASGGEIVFGDMREVVAWACSVRRVQSEQGPKAFVANGVAMPT